MIVNTDNNQLPIHKEEKEAKSNNSLLNYECDEEDDGLDWET